MRIAGTKSDKVCADCPYRLGIIKTVISPCPNCRLNRHSSYKRFKGFFEKKYESAVKRSSH